MSENTNNDFFCQIKRGPKGLSYYNLQCVIASVYLSAECPVLQVSGQFADNTAESHTGEHADADIRLLKV